MTELSALHVKISGDANGLSAALGTAQKGLDTFRKTAESSAKVFERAFASSEKAVDNLRRSIDPIYAASKRYEGAVEQLNSALRMGTIQQGEYNRLLDQAGVAYLRNSNQVQAMGSRFGFLGSMSQQTQGKIQQLGFQIQDVAVQLAAGTRATTVFAQQGSQILSIFGPVGSMLGVLAAVGLPLLGAAFLSAGNDAKSFKDTLADLEASTASLKAVTDIYSMEGLQQLKEKYGEVTIEVLRLLEAQREQTLFESVQKSISAVQMLRDQFGGLIDNIDLQSKAGMLAMTEMRSQTGLTAQGVHDLKRALEEMGDATTTEQQVAALVKIRNILEESKLKGSELWKQLLNAEDAIRAANAEGAKAGGWLASAVSGAQTWAAALWDAAAAAAAARDANFTPGTYTEGGMDAAKGRVQPGGGVAIATRPVGPVSASGGGGGSDPYAAEIESLRASLLSKEEIEIASYAKRQEALRAALEQRLITEEEFLRLSEEAQRQHADKMSELDVWRYGSGLDKASAFFGGMAAAMQGGNEKMLAISKKFAAAEALINAWQAASQVLKDPTLPFWAKIPSAMKVLAAGMGMVNAIKGGGGSGSAGKVAAVGGGGASQGQSTIGTYVNIALQGANYGETQVRGLIEQINKAVENGAVLKGIRVV